VKQAAGPKGEQPPFALRQTHCGSAAGKPSSSPDLPRESGARRLFALADDCRDSVDRERERERAVLGTMIHNGGSRAASAHGLRITTLRSASPHTLDGVASYMAKTFPGL